MSEHVELLLTPQQMIVQKSVELCLGKIDQVLNGRYVLTLVARYKGPPPLEDADILMTADTRENVLRVVNRFLPETDPQPTPPPQSATEDGQPTTLPPPRGAMEDGQPSTNQ